jgi:hypothetical protein
MPKNNLATSRRRHRRHGRVAGMFTAASCLVSLFSSPAHAHVISIGRGWVVVHPDHLRVEWKVATEDFVHDYGLGTTPARPLTSAAIRRVAARHADYLLKRLIIRDSEGNRLFGKLVSRTTDPALNANLDRERLLSLRITYVFEYKLKRSPRYLAFQQSPDEGTVESPSQLYLDVSLAGTRRSKIIQLTNGGNVETLKFNWPDVDGGRPTIVGPIKELKSVLAYIDVADDGVRVTLEVPLPVLETFLHVDRADRDFLEVSEQMTATPRLVAFFRNRTSISINGPVAEPSRARLEFLGADSSGPDTNRPSVRLSTWMTRVRFIQSYEPNSRPERIELRWNVFNPAVLVAEVLVTCGSQRSAHRISTYEPTLRWARSATDKAGN